MNKLLGFLFFSAIFLGVHADSLTEDLHANWEKLLQKHVSASGVVNYNGFKASEKQLDDYLAFIESHAPEVSWSKNKTMAYWINAYNAYTIKLILKNMPLKSIMEINQGKAWDLNFIPHGSQKISLNHIEHKILREKYKDPRIHFAVNCASFSCPKLSNKAFTESNLNAQLDALSRSFINNSKKNIISKSSVKISQLFNWYKGDFSDGNSVIPFINKYSTTKVDSDAKVDFLEYNWSLNN